MRIGAVQDEIHPLIRMMILDEGKKIRTEISPIQIFESFFCCKEIIELQSDPVRQDDISAEERLLICMIDTLNIHGFIISKQGLAKNFDRIRRMMVIKQLLSCDIGEIQIIYDTRTFLVIYAKNMLACAISGS